MLTIGMHAAQIRAFKRARRLRVQPCCLKESRLSGPWPALFWPAKCDRACYKTFLIEITTPTLKGFIAFRCRALETYGLWKVLDNGALCALPVEHVSTASKDRVDKNLQHRTSHISGHTSA